MIPPFHCSDAGVLWGRTVLRNCIADEAKNRASAAPRSPILRFSVDRSPRPSKGRNACKNAGVDTPSQLRFYVVELTARSSSSGAVDRRDVVGASQRQARGATETASPKYGLRGFGIGRSANRLSWVARLRVWTLVPFWACQGLLSPRSGSRAGSIAQDLKCCRSCPSWSYSS
jgi:hypothetical protein